MSSRRLDMKGFLFLVITLYLFPSYGERGKYFSDKFIICDTDIKNWPKIRKKGYYAPDVLKTIGFIHCSKPSHMAYVLPNYYNNEHRIAWVIDPRKVRSPVIYEGNHIQPHIYGPLNMSAVIDIFELMPKSNGSYEIPEEWLLPKYDMEYLCKHKGGE
jgi:uncharacterized protein (DUF952 family)